MLLYLYFLLWFRLPPLVVSHAFSSWIIYKYVLVLTVWDMKSYNAGSVILLSGDHLLPRLADNKEKSGSTNLLCVYVCIAPSTVGSMYYRHCYGVKGPYCSRHYTGRQQNMVPSQRAQEQSVVYDQLVFAAESCRGPVDQSCLYKMMAHIIMTRIYPTDIIRGSMLHFCRGLGKAVFYIIWEESASTT